MDKNINKDVNILNVLDVYESFNDKPWRRETISENMENIYRLSFFCEGSFTDKMDGRIFTVESPAITFFPLTTEVKRKSNIIPTRFITSVFITDKPVVLSSKELIQLSVKPENPDKIKNKFEELKEIFSINAKSDNMQVRGLTMFLLGEFLNGIARMENDTQIPPFIADALVDIEKYRDRSVNLNVHDIAEKYHVNYEYFIREFKKYVGVSPKQHILNIKMEHTGTLVKKTNFPMDQIAFMMGFTNMNYFYECFKKYYGKTPSEYWNKNRSENKKNI